VVAVVCGRASAVQPLSEFLAGARRMNVDNREAALVAVEQNDEALTRLGSALPQLSARGIYARNEFETAVNFSLVAGQPAQHFTIVPLNQYDAFVQADVPIIDTVAWARARAARQSARAAEHGRSATVLDVEKQVARSYYQYIGALALEGSAERTLAASQANHALTIERQRGGVATQLDVQRAAAEVERDKQNIADAVLQAQLAHRSLRTLTGLDADASAPDETDDLREEPPLEEWERTPDEQIPALASAAEQTRSAQTLAAAAKFALVPSLSAQFLEHFTNATGFLGRHSLYTLTLTAAWRFDLTTVGLWRSTQANAEIAAVRQERVRLGVHDAIHESWQRVRAEIAKSRAARAQVRAAELAAEYARERYKSGAGTQLEVVDAQRDAFAADVARIQSDADLSYTRALLRLNAGKALDPEHDR
jgi:outer membrane protein TolC